MDIDFIIKYFYFSYIEITQIYSLFPDVFNMLKKHDKKLEYSIKSDHDKLFKEALATILTKQIICFGNW